MNELETQLTQRVGLSPDQARQAVEFMLQFIKGRLPAPIASSIEGLLGQTTPGAEGVTSSAPELGALASELGGFLKR